MQKVPKEGLLNGLYSNDFSVFKGTERCFPVIHGRNLYKKAWENFWHKIQSKTYSKVRQNKKDMINDAATFAYYTRFFWWR